MPGISIVAALLVTAATVSGGLIGAGYGPSMIAAATLLGWWVPVIARCDRGLYGLLAYLPFAGAVSLALSPDRLPLLLKDILFVAPAYVGLVAEFVVRRERLSVPIIPIALMGALAIVAGAQVFGPGVANALMTMIGLKVWLFYLPLYLVAFHAMRSREDVWRVMRLLTALTTVPCLVGLSEYVLSLSFGYPEVMTAIYGGLAADVTQGFTVFELGPGHLMRIPSTFSFVSQYWGFTLAMLVPCYAVWRGDPSDRWRRAAAGILILDLTAGMLSGSRGAFIFIPLLLGMTVLLDRKVRAVVVFLPVVTPATVVAAAGLGFRPLFDHVYGLFGHYARDAAYGGLLTALERGPFGAGTGTNTGPARYAVADPGAFEAIESYYAKAAYELGLPGLMLIVLMFGWIIWSGWRVTRQVGDELRPCAAALTAFALCIALNSFKGWQLDLDPINVYFWVFAGILSRIAGLDDSRSRRPFVRNLVPGGMKTGAPRAAVVSGRGFDRRTALHVDSAWLHGRWRA
jgi:hypothetical protein